MATRGELVEEVTVLSFPSYFIYITNKENGTLLWLSVI